MAEAEANKETPGSELQADLGELTERARLLGAILNGIPGMVAYWDGDLHNRFANRSYLDTFARNGQAITGQHIREVLGEAIFELNRPLIEATLRGQPQRYERPLVKPGSEATLNIQVNLVPDLVEGQVKGFFVLLSDITQIKQAEEKSEAASRAKGDFLASMSHEIRTPLHAMLGLAQVGIRATTDPKAVQNFQHILESGQHLLALINDVLDFSKIEAGQVSLEADRVDLGLVVEQAMKMVAARAQAKQIELRLEQGPGTPRSFKGDELRTTQLLINLLSNAVKFTAQGSVTLQVDGDDQWLTLRVTDTGIGMTPEVRANLFQPFVQGDSSNTRRVGGSGLGLSICKRLLDLMGGDIRVSSQPGEGSAFDIHLPLLDAQHDGTPLLAFELDSDAAADQAMTSNAPQLMDVRILVAEDHPVNQMVLCELLATEGARVTCMDNGALALAQIRAGIPFDVMLCDIEMPVMDGYEATRQIKALAPSMPIIGLTAHAFEVARQQGLGAGMSDYLTKPYMINQLIKTIRKQLQAPAPASTLQAVALAPNSFHIDRQALVNHYPQGHQFIDRLFQTIKDSSQALPGQLREAAARRDLEGLRSLAHSTKGMAANLLVNDLRWLASHIDELCSTQPEAAFSAADSLAHAVEAMIRSLGLD
ncbi:PAS domain-containing sensor histidine kinase [Aquabacterium sp.]|uniref:PAS domain-containing sensor histidine kinase n=1 Tax=Aquabacterium sp. TaxID=1872578 RepID=UPI0019C380C9|nr:PAS domain-containing sensor histidine kinase [Aquabacterium sp.]MBC7699842.1 response regulator [Aquabacterium sp.]